MIRRMFRRIAETGGATASRRELQRSSRLRVQDAQQIADGQQTTRPLYMRRARRWRDGRRPVQEGEDIRVFYSQPWVMVGSD